MPDSTKPCGTCKGGGLVSAVNCTCPGPGHTCTPRPCPDCRGGA